MDQAKFFAEKLLDIEAVKLSIDKPFTWASGWHSPIYCDNRKTLSHPFLRTFIKDQLTLLAREFYPEAKAISGVATAGIPHGVLLADALELPFSYVRSSQKSHGMSNQIEGSIHKDSPIIVIEDLISTGMSSLNAVEALRNEGYTVLGMLGLFTYGFPQAEEAFKKANCSLYTLTNYEVLIKLAIEKKIVQNHESKTLSDWRLHPDTWNK